MPSVDNAELWLTLLVAVGLFYGFWLFIRGDYSLWETVLFLPAYLVTRLLWRVHFSNQAPEAMRGGAILAANHRSSIDPMFVQLAARRRVHWMVAKEYCQNFAFGPILKALQVIPTNRSGTDINSTKLAMNLAKQGKLVGMFPEGRINVTRDPLLSLRAGAAMVAAKASVPIIPIFIEGSPYEETFSVVSPFLMRSRVKVTFGKPIYPVEDSHDVANAIDTDQLQDGSRRGFLNEKAAKLMHQWAEEMLSMSGNRSFEVQIGSSARRRNQLSQIDSSEP